MPPSQNPPSQQLGGVIHCAPSLYECRLTCLLNKMITWFNSSLNFKHKVHLFLCVSDNKFSKNMSRTMRVTKCPSDTLSMTNRVVVNTEDWDPATTPHLQAGGPISPWVAVSEKFNTKRKLAKNFFGQISTGPGQKFIMSCIADSSIPR